MNPYEQVMDQLLLTLEPGYAYTAQDLLEYTHFHPLEMAPVLEWRIARGDLKRIYCVTLPGEEPVYFEKFSHIDIDEATPLDLTLLYMLDGLALQRRTPTRGYAPTEEFDVSLPFS